MLAELAEVDGSRARWAFGLGCARAATGMRIRGALSAPNRGGIATRATVVTAAMLVLALGGYVLVHYPSLRTGLQPWAASACLLIVVAGYVVAALTVSRGGNPGPTRARRYGVAGGLVAGAMWLLILVPPPGLKAWVAVPLLGALGVPAAVAMLAARPTGGGAVAGRGAALWSGLVGGLVCFIVPVTAACLTHGRPYDPQLVRDFHHSGAHDLAAYSISGTIGTALGLLLIIPTIALALGDRAAWHACRIQSKRS